MQNKYNEDRRIFSSCWHVDKSELLSDFPIKCYKENDTRYLIKTVGITVGCHWDFREK